MQSGSEGDLGGGGNVMFGGPLWKKLMKDVMLRFNSSAGVVFIPGVASDKPVDSMYRPRRMLSVGFM